MYNFIGLIFETDIKSINYNDSNYLIFLNKQFFYTNYKDINHWSLFPVA